MKFNDFFSLPRFGLLVKHDLMINKNKYVLKMLVFVLGLYALMVYFMMNNPHSFCVSRYTGGLFAPQGYVQLLAFSLIALGVFVGSSFSDLGNKVKRTSFMLLPASTFEKMLHPFLLRVVFGILCYLFFFWSDAHLARMSVVNAPSIVNSGLILAPLTFTQVMNGLGNDSAVNVLFAIFSLGMYLFVVPLFFKKQALLKAIVFFFAGLFAYICFFVLLTHLFYPSVYEGFNFHVPDYIVYKKQTCFELLFNSIANFSWVFLLFIGYFKLKELKL